jgi:hypothetical protein
VLVLEHIASPSRRLRTPVEYASTLTVHSLCAGGTAHSACICRKETTMRRLILIFLVVIAVGAVTGASASDSPGPGTALIHPPSLPSDVTCTPKANGTSGTICFYPARSRYFYPEPAR